MYGGKDYLIQEIRVDKDSKDKDRDNKDGETPDSSLDGDSLDSLDNQVSKANGVNKASKDSGVNQGNRDNKEDGVNQGNKDNKEDGVSKDSKVSEAISKEATIHGDSKETVTSKCKATSKWTTQEDGTINMIKNFNRMSNKFSRDTTKTTLVVLRVSNSSWPTETLPSPWAWLLPTINNKFTRPCSSVIPIGTVELTKWKCSTCSRECRVFREVR